MNRRIVLLCIVLFKTLRLQKISKRNQTSIIARMNVGNSIKFKVGFGGEK